jgi:hypothetical protein
MPQEWISWVLKSEFAISSWLILVCDSLLHLGERWSGDYPFIVIILGTYKSFKAVTFWVTIPVINICALPACGLCWMSVVQISVCRWKWAWLQTILPAWPHIDFYLQWQEDVQFICVNGLVSQCGTTEWREAGWSAWWIRVYQDLR